MHCCNPNADVNYIRACRGPIVSLLHWRLFYCSSQFTPKGVYFRVSRDIINVLRGDGHRRVSATRETNNIMTGDIYIDSRLESISGALEDVVGSREAFNMGLSPGQDFVLVDITLYEDGHPNDLANEHYRQFICEKLKEKFNGLETYFEYPYKSDSPRLILIKLDSISI